jgi:glycosyltransferase involved in cell wall biosynthesis
MSDRASKIAILIPTFNGGALLADSIASAARLPAHSYEIVVVDNASTDASTDALPAQDANGACLTVIRNDSNLGRVQNWNRALEAAEAMGFRHALFLMVGDMVSDDSLLLLRERMMAAGAALGLASYRVVDERLHPLRLARRLDWHGASISARRFLEQSLPGGVLAFGPLNANLYDLTAARLRFDPADPTHTDHHATIRFLEAAQRPVVYLDRPITVWRARKDRFHSSMSLNARLDGDLNLIRTACQETGLIPDEQKIRCTLLLRVLFHCRGNVLRAWPVVRRYWPQHFCWRWIFGMLARQIRLGTPWRIAA